MIPGDVEASPSRLEMARILLQRESKEERRNRIAINHERDGIKEVDLQRPPQHSAEIRGARIRKASNRLRQRLDSKLQQGVAGRSEDRPGTRSKLNSRSITPGPTRRRLFNAKAARSATPVVRRGAMKSASRDRSSNSRVRNNKSPVSSVATTLRKSRHTSSKSSLISSSAPTLKKERPSTSSSANLRPSSSTSKGHKRTSSGWQGRIDKNLSDAKENKYQENSPSISAAKSSNRTSAKKSYRSKSLKSSRMRATRSARKTRSKSPADEKPAGHQRKASNLSVNTAAENLAGLHHKPWTPPAQKKLGLLFDPLMKYSPR